jgi:hypothetical protein
LLSLLIFSFSVGRDEPDAAQSGGLVTYSRLWNDYERYMTSVSEEPRDLYSHEFTTETFALTFSFFYITFCAFNKRNCYQNVSLLEGLQFLLLLSRVLYSEELHNLYSSPDIIRQIKSKRMRWAGHVARMGEEIKLYKVLVGKHEGKRPLRRPRCRWEQNGS